MTGAAALTVDGLRRSFHGNTALDGLDLDVHAGEVHAVVGLNGAGKTTLFRLLLGMLRPDAGRARVLGVDATDAPRALWRRVGHLVEAPLAYPELTVRENLTAAALLHGMGAAAAEPAVASWVDRLALHPWLDRRASHLSSGNRQRLGLAAALVHGPEVLVLDEPANALDPAGVVLVRDVLRELRSDGVAVLVSSHHLDQLARIADHITVLHRGRCVGSLEPDGVDLERTFFELVHAADRGATEAA